MPTGNAPSGWKLRRKPPDRNVNIIPTELSVSGSAAPKCGVAPEHTATLKVRTVESMRQ